MTDPVTLRDSTQIVLAHGALDGMREAFEDEFAVSVHEAGPSVRIIGSPGEIKAVTRFLARCGSPCRSARLFPRTHGSGT